MSSRQPSHNDSTVFPAIHRDVTSPRDLVTGRRRHHVDCSDDEPVTSRAPALHVSGRGVIKSQSSFSDNGRPRITWPSDPDTHETKQYLRIITDVIQKLDHDVQVR